MSLAVIMAAAGAGNGNIASEVDQAQADRDARLTGYSVTEHYTIQNSRFGSPVDAVVAATYVKGTGKTYRVVSESGPPFLQTRVLDRILKEEEAMSHGEERRSAIVTSANYQIEPAGHESLDGRACDVVELTPRMKSAHLLKGKAWLDASSHVLIRIDGKATAKPAFLAGTPNVVREYEEIDGFSLARKTQAVSQSFLLGKTNLTIEYSDYKLNPAPSREPRSQVPPAPGRGVSSSR